MSRTVAAFAAALALLQPAAPHAASTPAAQVLHARGLGALVVGMPLDKARRIPGIALEPQGPPPVPADYCTYFAGRLDGKPFRLRVMEDRVNRIELNAAGFRTRSGIAVGDSLEQVKRTYGKALAVEPHHYLWRQGFVLMVLGPYRIEGSDYGMAFVTSPEKGVTEIRAGPYEEIRQSEGCQ